MDLSVPSEARVDLIALCRRWQEENRAMADDLLARRVVHSELVARAWQNVSADDADRHARVAAELELLLLELEAADHHQHRL